MMDLKIRVGVLVPVLRADVGCKAHRVGIASPEGSILEEFTIPHSQEGFRYPKNGHREFFDWLEWHRHDLNLPVAGGFLTSSSV